MIQRPPSAEFTLSDAKGLRASAQGRLCAEALNGARTKAMEALSDIRKIMPRHILVPLIFMAAACASMQPASVSTGNAGLVALARGNNDEAIRDLTRALNSGDLSTRDQALAYMDRGAAYYNKGEYAKAIADYNASISLLPDYASSYSNRGNAYAAMGDYDKAIADGDSAIRLNPKYAMAYNNRGLAYQGKREFDKAIADFDAAIRLNPDIAPAYNNRGNAYQDKGEYGKAIADLDTAIRLTPNSASAHYNRGRARFLTDNFDNAEWDFQRALDIDPQQEFEGFGVLLLHLSRIRTGQDDAAELRGNAARIDLAKWPGPIVALYAGQATFAQVMVAAAKGDAKTQHDQDCQADFYLGEYALTRHDSGQAAAMLREARDTCPQNFLEYVAALRELQRMGQSLRTQSACAPARAPRCSAIEERKG